MLFGAVAAVAVSSARADCCNPCPAPCAPAMKTITCTEYVRENFTTTRTCYKYECKQESYTAYKTVCVPETRTRCVTCYKRVPEMRTQTVNVCVKVPCVEERTVMKRHWETQTCTRMVCKTVDRGHWECKEVPCGESSNWLRGLGHRRDCCNPCEPCACPRTRTVKCWVPCRETIQCPVTTCKRVCVCVPCKVQVNVCKTVTKQECRQVCCYKCVPETRNECYTVNVRKCVPYQACRTVRVCVPYQQTVTCCRMVPRTVTRQVPCETAPACAPTSGCGCESGCGTGCGCSHRRFAGLFHRERGCGCGCN